MAATSASVLGSMVCSALTRSAPGTCAANTQFALLSSIASTRVFSWSRAVGNEQDDYTNPPKVAHHRTLYTRRRFALMVSVDRFAGRGRNRYPPLISLGDRHGGVDGAARGEPSPSWRAPKRDGAPRHRSKLAKSLPGCQTMSIVRGGPSKSAVIREMSAIGCAFDSVPTTSPDSVRAASIIPARSGDASTRPRGCGAGCNIPRTGCASRRTGCASCRARTIRKLYRGPGLHIAISTGPFRN